MQFIGNPVYLSELLSLSREVTTLPSSHAWPSCLFQTPIRIMPLVLK